MTNKVTKSLLAIVLVLVVWLTYENFKFPIKYIICDQLYENCFVHAKFKYMDSCQIIKEKGGWYCDQTDKRNIKCEERDSQISTAYCSE
ncbi:MAG: hypothetical protein Q7S19_02655 [bacterium]|nr:hypothetical protein [bacterium]